MVSIDHNYLLEQREHGLGNHKAYAPPSTKTQLMLFVQRNIRVSEYSRNQSFGGLLGLASFTVSLLLLLAVSLGLLGGSKLGFLLVIVFCCG